MTEKLIIDAFCLDKLFHNTNDKLFPNTFLNKYEADIFLVTKSGYLHEYEIKLSRSDFFADFKKKNKHNLIKEGKRVNYFSYIVPKGLIKPEEVPEYARLFEIESVRYTNTRKQGNYSDFDDYEEPRIILSHVKGARKLSSEKLGEKHLPKLYESIYYRFHSKSRENYKIEKTN